MSKSVVVGIIVVIIILAGGGALLAANHNSGNKTSSSTASKNAVSGMDMSQSNASSQSGQSSSSSQSSTVNSNNVTIQNFAFSPASLTVKKGTTVTWTNQDSATHTATETDSQDGPKSGDLPTGKSYSFTFNTAGTFKYDCSIHPNMTGTVTVTE